MIVAKTPLRISLAGGSTDLVEFLKENEYGRVISFNPNLFTYIFLNKSINNKYNIIYSKIERKNYIRDIKNDIARIILSFYNVDPVTIIFESDVPNSSGLASSSSYTISLIKAVRKYKNLPDMSDEKIAKLAFFLERKFNSRTGYQDPFGCAIQGFKELFIKLEDGVSVSFFNQERIFSLFDNVDIYLINTNITTKSTKILKKISFQKVKHLLNSAEDMRQVLSSSNPDINKFFKIISDGWQNKKQTTSKILNKHKLVSLDNKLLNDKNILSHRLCGSGGGGYFLVFAKAHYELEKQYKGAFKIKILKKCNGFSNQAAVI